MLQHPSTYSCVGNDTVAPAAQQRMLEVCRQVITRAAQDTWQQTASQHPHEGASHRVTDGTSWEQVNQQTQHAANAIQRMLTMHTIISIAKAPCLVLLKYFYENAGLLAVCSCSAG